MKIKITKKDVKKDGIYDAIVQDVREDDDRVVFEFRLADSGQTFSKGYDKELTPGTRLADDFETIMAGEIKITAGDEEVELTKAITKKCRLGLQRRTRQGKPDTYLPTVVVPAN